MPLADVSITVNGTPLSFIDYWGSPVVTHRWPYGSWELTWSMGLPPGFRHPDLIVGAEVIAWVGPSRIWRGVLAEPNLDEMTFTALGSAREAETAQALDGSNAPTSVPNTAINQASSRGAIHWSQVGIYPISNTAYANEETDAYNSVSQLLDAYSASVGKRWWVDVQGFAHLDADPTEPAFTVVPGAGVLGVADEDYVTHLYGWYNPKPRQVRRVTAVDTTQSVARVERRVDLTGLGYITATKAQAVLDGMLAKGAARTGWTNGIEVGHGQILNMGGEAVSLADVRAGARVRLEGLTDERGLSAATEIVLSETVWNVHDGLLTMSPVGLVERNFAGIVEKMGGVLL